MSKRKTQEEIERRLAEARRLLRARHAGFEPDAAFAGRVIARLPHDTPWAFEWAVRRILPASVALAVVLMIAVVATGGFSVRTTASAETGNDPLEWLLEGRQEVR